MATVLLEMKVILRIKRSRGHLAGLMATLQSPPPTFFKTKVLMVFLVFSLEYFYGDAVELPAVAYRPKSVYPRKQNTFNPLIIVQLR